MKKIITIIVAAAIVLAAGIFAIIHFSAPEKEQTQSDRPDLLVSMTDQKLMTSYYKNNKVLHKEKMTDYPASALDRKHNILYYTNTDESGVKRLIKLELKTGKKTTLYSGKEYVDELSLSKDGSKLFMRYNQPEERNFHLASFDLKTKSFTVIYPKLSDKDETVSFYQYDQNSGKSVLLHYSESEDYKKTDEANSKGIDPEPTNMRISLADEKHEKEIKTIAKFINDIAISPDGKTIVFTSTDAEGEKTAIYELDLETKKYQSIIADGRDFTLIDSAEPQFSKDGKTIYFLAEAKGAKILKDDAGNEANVRTIFAYDRDTKKVSKEWEQSNGIINGFTVLN
ncbi:TolB family protein [Bacillus glycinifermentans]|uniref:PD40 domain-containing protein n=1 Tax=Bacillus glycinifermentans TaxID=1664069 RepID=A0A0T6BPX6_9BACI|nr:PD40 domain-containing protein [Bacillus glycinifermentans]ATH94600.1 hypothetical protein COP00_20100 [Bacillus glycinifermentans]KRT93661.1 hypothetical protein AB447_217855 [Bacillus glycinifermentans]MEC0486119.1 PD40 domain-containing protein [Bacillus glycinifermentans]MEC0494023.1 PD40 domain-containing protein [Bacillus glycinifermentans]MEC0542196.1 PD40 domain-containing protein [Bacillus glycinifermentans]